MFKQKMALLRAKSARMAVVVGVVAAPVLAHADTGTTFDPSTYVTAIIATIAGLLAIGGATFSVVLAIKSTKWARRAL